MDRAALRQALDQGHLPTLLMVHTHLTHDEAFLDRFAPHVQSPYAQPRRERPERPLPPGDFKVLVIGAGLTGLAGALEHAQVLDPRRDLHVEAEPLRVVRDVAQRPAHTLAHALAWLARHAA